MKKIITTILSLSLLAGNAAIPVFAENESAEGVTERVEVMAEDTVIEPTPEIEVPAENTVIEPTPEIEVPAEEVLQAEQSQKTDEPVFDVPLFDEPVFPEAEKKPKEDFELFSSDFSLMASNGSCGENVTYTLDDAGTLTISGTGAMNNYNYGQTPFYNNTKIKTVIIESCVTSIGSDAFRGCSGLKSITIPDSVTSIGGCAFSGCSGLTTVNYNATYCAYMGSYNYTVFNGCNALTTVNIGNKVTNIPSYAFCGCSGLTNITIPDSVTSIGDYAFYSCSGLTSITIPDSVTSIGSYAFNGCSGLTSITIGGGVTSIGERAFYGCSGLTSVYVSDLASYLNINFGYNYSNPMAYASKLYVNNKRVAGDVVIPDTVTKIPMYAFHNCDGITSITIPDSVTSIDEYAFFGCSGLTSITIGGSVTSIGSSAFYHCSGITSITIPDSVTSIGDGAFSGCSGLTSVYVSDLAAYLNINFGYNYSNPLFYASKLYVNNKLVEGDVVIPDTVTKIPRYAFYGCNGITSITIPDGVTSIDSTAFNKCSGLTSVNFNATKSYTTFSPFNGCNALIAVNIGDNVMNIPSRLFEDCSGLTSITIPDSVTSIDALAFRGCSGLTSITIGGGVTSIGDNAFRGCSGLTEITIPDSVTSIGDGAFSGCSNLEVFNYNAVNASVGEYVFGKDYDEKSPVREVNIGSNVEALPNKLFNGLTSLMLAKLGDKVSSIGESTFAGCTNLKKLYIPKATTEIEKSAFSNCNSLSAVEYGGTESDWKTIYFGTGNDYLKNAKINYNSLPENAALTDLDYLTYTKRDDNTVTITNCNDAATKINIPASIDGLPVTAINASAFANRKNLKSVTIPDSVTNIGSSAFDGCSNLKNISIPSGITTIASNTFYNCSSLEAVSLPESVTTINGYAFYGCDKLSNVYYSGNKNKWNEINFNYGNDNLKNATVTYGKAPTYTITTGTKFGTITPDKTSAAMGEKVTFTVTPTSGYMLTDGSVKVNNGEVSMTSNGSSYSFTMPDKNVTITAAFEKIPPEMVTVSFNAGDGTLKGSSTMKVEKGKALTQSGIPTAEKDGYKFSGWLLNGKTFSLDTPITENITLTALWVENEIQKSTVPTLSKYADIMNFEKSAGANGGAIFTVTKKGNAKVPQPVVFVAHFGTDGTLQSADKFDFTKNGDTYTAIVDKQTGNYKLFVWTDDAASMLEPITAPLTAADRVFE